MITSIKFEISKFVILNGDNRADNGWLSKAAPTHYLHQKSFAMNPKEKNYKRKSQNQNA